MSNLPDETTEYQAPSVFAKGPHFPDWMTSMKVDKETPSSAVEANYDQLSEFCLPKSLLQRQFNALEVWTRISQALNDWATLHPASLSDRDENSMDETSPVLCHLYGSIIRSTTTHAKEIAQRHGIDGLIALAFSIRGGCPCQVQMEAAFRLCAFPQDAHQTPKTLPKPVLIADTLVTCTPLSKGRFIDLEPNPGYLRHMHWGSTAELSLIVFVGEFKWVESRNNKNQLIMALLTAQHQRRALGLKEAIIIGATYTNTKFEVYSSWWRSADGLAYCAHLALDLTNPVDFLRCYSLLCNLRRRVKPLVDELNGKEAEVIIKSVKLHPWRAPSTPSTEVPFPKSGSGRKGSERPERPMNTNMDDDEEPKDMEPQEEAEWEASYEEWQKQSEEGWNLAPRKADVAVLTAQRLKELDGCDLKSKMKEWTESLGNGQFDPVGDPVPLDSKSQPAEQEQAV